MIKARPRELLALLRSVRERIFAEVNTYAKPIYAHALQVLEDHFADVSKMIAPAIGLGDAQRLNLVLTFCR
ncbi:MAG: hypothetical protein SGI86_03755, partial [Deltaproteobacteria bacterium]|nr:hypothetical protein [Deltaproteobacteria bacterium]